MKSVWGSLIWKEWHEHKWKLVALTAVLLALPAVSIIVDELEAIYFGSMISVYFALPVLILFVSASAAAGENSHRTMPFLQSQPIPAYQFAFVKLLLSMLTVCVPVTVVFLCVVAIETVFGLTGDGGWFVHLLLAGLGAACSVVIWLTAAGVNRTDEVRAGAIGILVIVCYAALLTTIGRWIEPSSTKEFPIWFKTLAVIGPGGPLLLMVVEGIRPPDAFRLLEYWPLLLFSALVHFGIACSFVARFGRVPTRLRPSEKSIPVTHGDWLAPPRRSKLGALAWKQFRESGPLALIAMCLIFSMWLILAVFLTYKVYNESAWGYVEEATIGLAEEGLKYTVASWIGLGFFVAIVAGIGAFFEDLRPKMDTFWRSRPINCDLWFWIKYGFGMAITLLAMLIPVLLALAFAAGRINTNSVIGDFDDGVLVVAIQATAFATAALAMILVRQAIYAAVLAIAVTPGFAVFSEYLEWGVQELALSFAVNALLATLLAWLAVRYDWSLRR